jgi:hypothetical protein
MKHLRTIVLLAAGTLALGVLTQQLAPAQAGGQGQKMGRGMPSVDDQLASLTSKLSLSADQQGKIKPILQDQQDQMQSLMKDQSLSPEDRKSKARDVHQATVAKVNDVLNDDQKKKYQALQQQMHEKARQHQESGAEPPK